MLAKLLSGLVKEASEVLLVSYQAMACSRCEQRAHLMRCLVSTLTSLLCAPSCVWLHADGGGSPQGLLHLLPGLGLHWYVHSTLTRVMYNVKLPDGQRLAGEGWAHVEKNWGGRCGWGGGVCGPTGGGYLFRARLGTCATILTLLGAACL
jgi:hypothetical protein